MSTHLATLRDTKGTEVDVQFGGPENPQLPTRLCIQIGDHIQLDALNAFALNVVLTKFLEKLSHQVGVGHTTHPSLRRPSQEERDG